MQHFSFLFLWKEKTAKQAASVDIPLPRIRLTSLKESKDLPRGLGKDCFQPMKQGKNIFIKISTDWSICARM